MGHRIWTGYQLNSLKMWKLFFRWLMTALYLQRFRKELQIQLLLYKWVLCTDKLWYTHQETERCRFWGIMFQIQEWRAMSAKRAEEISWDISLILSRHYSVQKLNIPTTFWKSKDQISGLLITETVYIFWSYSSAQK